MSLGRNDKCRCGSGKKYKHCHWAKDQKYKLKHPNKALDSEHSSAKEKLFLKISTIAGMIWAAILLFVFVYLDLGWDHNKDIRGNSDDQS